MQTIYDFDLKGLEEMLGTLGQKPYRAKQLFMWLYRKRAKTFDEMTDLPAALIEELKKRFVIMPLKEIDRQVAHDGTMKFLFEMQDGSSVESVLMHFAYGESLCVSSQVGCNMACTFCASGLLKKQRSLTAGEMVGEAMFVQELLDEDQRRLDNIVIMGTGEPFDNYDNVMRFCAIINSDHGLAIGARHITISTCGIVPRINDFADAHLQYNLAVSLHASNDALRRKLMPIDKAYPMDQLMAALKRYSENNHRRLTFEYILLRNVNDQDENAIELANLIRGMNAYVNLIPYNEVDENGYRTTDARTALHFYDVLMKHGVKATLRTKHGEDIDAACGQLRAKHEREKEA
ncbi:MAG: 23S rRNA (adenine(2503)-C(2))-methyltransferase RlmN [Erysipelotrichaceae bacterium]|jgi:23S rRNA (adenine2503-C2)-methyltransferase|nr:23S rRNA (adenine(2503)-C(2))-methyltransferase RlmN [Lactimicrobium massiliense]MCH4019710.1 23S rRNA (adenine(2503)-C(2))-methyltransferase RlmN [Erysipelotrichaceae bacterium]MCI1326471.1 23S rRNA (adenine(2503)-C(2))-methyltransferase RlmN [Solobacterium sp.]MCH4045297.1 23S rRNA (adenine(2503)-C(2))-methyltransferase RlmN [Erysipelotrichaceae bacterium]MCH4122507.1 23S rRNA (adenine(2503)-C(2))-methyltransferase RlmN [Erysipelotrichaceae bacterium]MCI1363038.1 23S rRNA (adenine(2503)-C